MSKLNKYKSMAINLLYGYSFAWILFCIASTYNLAKQGADLVIFGVVATFFFLISTSIVLIRKRHFSVAKFLLIIAPPYILLIVSIYAKSHGLLANVFFYLLPRIFVIFTLMAPIVFFGIRYHKKMIISVLAIAPPIFFFEVIHSYFGIELKNLPFVHDYYPQFIGFLSFVYGIPLFSLLFYQIVNLKFKKEIIQKSSLVNQEKTKVDTLNLELASNSNLFRIYEITSRNIPFKEVLQEVLDELLSIEKTVIQDKGSILLKDFTGDYEIIAQRNCDSKANITRIVNGETCCCDQIIEGENQNPITPHLIKKEKHNKITHKHYIIPITIDDEELGFMNLYIKDGQDQDLKTAYFLEKVAAILARKIISTQQINLIAQNSLEIKVQGEKLKSNHAELTESVSYAKLLQNSLLPNVKNMSNYLDDISILFLPKDEIGGDLYFIHQGDDHSYFGIGDCTGHGIPGALLAAMSIEAIKSVMNIYCGKKPNFILEKLRNIAKNRFNPSTMVDSRSDSMDAGLCMFDKTNNILHYSGGFINLMIVRDSEILEFHAERCPIGIYPDEKEFSLQSIPIEQNDVLYLASDGYTDQFGYDPSRKRSVKFKRKRFKELIISISNLSYEEQTSILKKNILTWKAGEDQIDDITVLIVKPWTNSSPSRTHSTSSEQLTWKN